ncbi:tRNA-modifying enzyme [Anaerohalosphaera lusitana]|uniref:tRNA-modifying enzyme n=1 Tax=Anaerohalosphaera lusitana TaxID=1936003 RepID=A0A1U9NK41_9BACT|nr:radical SAM protein [Anaerohalosphaera lusitana]AQT68303.1 tRNA-modifying enzyme [Anaerohalosphaera lusitana]
MGESKKYTFGPVPSRRLGLSLGVDLVPLKTCSQNCVYCQLGVHGEQTVERKPYVDIDVVLAELQQRIDGGLEADYITLSGSGEPTLHSQIGELIDRIHGMTDIPVALITNSTMLWDPAVRADCGKADVVLPSLDAGDGRTFEAMNRPEGSVTFTKLVDGLEKFCSEYKGKVWLEVFLCEGINTAPEEVARMKELVGKLDPDKVHLNTAVRPTADPQAKAVSAARLAAIAEEFGPKAEAVVDYAKLPARSDKDVDEGQVLEMLERRPCRIDDLCSSLGISIPRAINLLQRLLISEEVTAEARGLERWFRAKHA